MDNLVRSTPFSPTEEKLLALVREKVIYRSSADIRIFAKNGDEDAWILDFRSVLLTPEFLSVAAGVFWEKFKEKYPFQVGGLETVGIAFTAAIVLKGLEIGMPVSGFYIRKSRKPDGLQKNIEGHLTNDPIILVDDLINSGNSFLKQIVLLQNEGKRVSDVFALVRYRAQKYLLEENTNLTTFCTLDDLGLERPPAKGLMLPDYTAFSMRWVARNSKPSYFYRVPKSAPTIDSEKVYFGSDDGVMWALNQETGEEVWRFKIYGSGAKGKTIFSSPVVFRDNLFFGAYDGNFYAVDTLTGKKRWIYQDADWIGSSPAVAPNLGLVYVGLEYGLWKKRGGIVALDTETGKKKWEYIEMPLFTHGSPSYSNKYNVVAIGSNNGVLYLFRAAEGGLLWQFQAEGAIKAAPLFDDKRGYVIFGAFGGKIYILSVLDGSLVYSYQTEADIYSTPALWNDLVCVSSLDKRIYCINLDMLTLEWTFQTSGRVFASPRVINNMLYVGSNDGCLYELDILNGHNTAFFQTTERITNKVAYNERTKRFFLLTYANELYCLEKKNSF